MPDQDRDRLTPEEMAAWQPFVAAATVVIGALDAEMKAAFNISHFDHALLLLLASNPAHRARMSDLAALLHVEPSSLTYRVDGLVGRGLVERARDEGDRRVVRAVITPAGLRLLRQSRALHVAAVRRHFLSRVDPADAAVLAKVLTALARPELVCESSLSSPRSAAV